MKKYDYFSVVYSVVYSGKVFWKSILENYSGKVFWTTVTVRRPGRFHKADVKSMGTIFYKTKKHLKRDALNQGYQDSNLENDGVRVRCLTVWR